MMRTRFFVILVRESGPKSGKREIRGRKAKYLFDQEVGWFGKGAKKKEIKKI
jgi:hypothetical protein